MHSRARRPQDERLTERILRFCYGDYLWVFVVCMIVLLAVLYLIADHTAHSYNGACGGDSGSPFAAPASPRGEFCHRLDNGLDDWLVFPVPPLMAGLGLLLFYAGRASYLEGRRPLERTAGRTAALLIGLGLVTGSILPPATLVYTVHSLSPNCPGGTPAQPTEADIRCL
jgi:hypothetical protein